jgi:hypothetical protein
LLGVGLEGMESIATILAQHLLIDALPGEIIEAARE